MADKHRKWEDNVPGAFYVDKNCAYCTTCAELAPGNFRPSQNEDHYLVFKQPVSEVERKQCLDAVEQCPTGSIGSDG